MRYCLVDVKAALLVTVVAGLSPGQQVSPSRPAVIEICDALQRIDKLDGSVVAIRGYYRFGMELGGLYGRNCPKKLILDHAERAQAFDLAFASMVDQAELQHAANRLIQEKNVREAIQVTLVGVIRARRVDLTDIDGRKARNFGHLGVYPAEIVVRGVQDVSVTDAPEFPSNMAPNRHW
jgi:hypothetical protein